MGSIGSAREPHQTGNEEEIKLSEWCADQRDYYKKGKLQKHTGRVNKLE